MNILHTVANYYPSVGGMQEAVRQISERLVKLGHEVTVATARMTERENVCINGVNIIEFDIKGNAQKGYKGEVDNYRKFLLNSRFDIIANFAAQQWATDIMMSLLDEIRTKKVFIPTGFSGLYSREYRSYFKQMGELMMKYDMNVFLSDDYRDVNFARSHNVEKRVLIPNGAAAEEFLAEPAVDIRKKLGIPPGHLLIINVGSHTGIKGHAEAIKIFRRACISDATFLIIGNEYWNGCARFCRSKQIFLNLLPSLRRSGKRLITSSLTRAETVAAYKQADLFLFSSNIECSPIVLFECMASKTPFLTTDVGNAAEIVNWSGAGLLLPTVITKKGFSKAIIKESSKILADMCLDPALRERMKEAGFQAWKEKFTWEQIAIDYEKLYSSLSLQPN